MIARELGTEPCLEVVDGARAGDLIADVELLERVMGPDFTPFEEAIRRTVNEPAT